MPLPVPADEAKTVWWPQEGLSATPCLARKLPSGTPQVREVRKQAENPETDPPSGSPPAAARVPTHEASTGTRAPSHGWARSPIQPPSSSSSARPRSNGICRAASVTSSMPGCPPQRHVPDERRSTSKCSKSAELVPVTLHVYDLTWFTKFLQLPVFHLGVEVHGREYSFGTAHCGIVAGAPGHNIRSARKRENVPLGYTLLSIPELQSIVKQLGTEWPASSYDILRRNCVTFAVTLCRHLGVERHIPSEYSRFAEFGVGAITGCRTAAACRSREPTLSCVPRGDDDNHSADLLQADQGGVVKVVPVRVD